MGWLPLLVLTTRGRKSGMARHTVLEYRRHGSKYYIISGWGKRPNWYQNLLAHPTVTVQKGAYTFKARAATVTDTAEALRAIYMFRRNSMIYDRLLASMSSADRIDFLTLTEVAQEFTVVRLDPQEGEIELDGVPVTNRWLAPLLGATLLLLIIRQWSRRYHE